jgi:hypothetical protein
LTLLPATGLAGPVRPDTERSELPSTCAWAEATGGALDPQQRKLIRRAIARGYADIFWGLASRPLRRPASVAVPSAPDSKLAREAETAARDQGPTLAGHGYRTWILGHALAAQDRRRVDPELFYVAALLHDAGIVSAVVGEDFTIRSARAVAEVAARVRPEDPSLATSLADSVVAHTTPGLTADIDPVGFYVQVGALADLAALRRWDLPRGYTRAAYRAHPAHRVHRAVAALISQEARAVPDGRYAMLRRAGMHHMVRFSPNQRL